MASPRIGLSKVTGLESGAVSLQSAVETHLLLARKPEMSPRKSHPMIDIVHSSHLETDPG
jgi:hypothetical protein